MSEEEYELALIGLEATLAEKNKRIDELQRRRELSDEINDKLWRASLEKLEAVAKILEIEPQR